MRFYAVVKDFIAHLFFFTKYLLKISKADTYENTCTFFNSFPNTQFLDSPNSKKLQTTNEMWLFKDFKTEQIACKTLWKKRQIAHFEHFHLFTQCFPKAFYFNVSK